MTVLTTLLVLLASVQTAALPAGRLDDALRSLTPQKTATALLLGVRNDDGYQTLLLEYAPGRDVNVVANLPVLAVPQDGKFAYVYKRVYDSVSVVEDEPEPGRRVVYREHWEELIVGQDRAGAERGAEAALAETEPPAPPCNNCELWDWEDHIDIGYVVPGHVTVETYGSGYTGGAHPNQYTNSFTVHFSSLAPRVVNYVNDDSDDRLVESQLAELYPVARDPGVVERMHRELVIRGKLEYFIDSQENDASFEPYDSTEYTGVPLADIEGVYEVDTTAVDLVLVRVRGRVHLKCQADASAGYAESGDYALTAEYDCGALSPAVAPHNTFPASYTAFLRADSTIRDVLIAPTQNIVYILADDTLRGYDVATKKQVFEYVLPEASKVVMVEWTAGDAGAWKAALQ